MLPRCGLRPIRCLLHYDGHGEPDATAAVCGQFAVCYTPGLCQTNAVSAAVCGQFAVCYTRHPSARTQQLGCGLRPIRCLLHSNCSPRAASRRCGLRPIRCLLHSRSILSTSRPSLRFAANSLSATLFPCRLLLPRGCGLRPIRCLLHCRLAGYRRVLAAVCGQFAVCYTPNTRQNSDRAAAVCGQFAVCYTTRRGHECLACAAVCGQFAVCYTNFFPLPMR